MKSDKGDSKDKEEVQKKVEDLKKEFESLDKKHSELAQEAKLAESKLDELSEAKEFADEEFEVAEKLLERVKKIKSDIPDAPGYQPGKPVRRWSKDLTRSEILNIDSENPVVSWRWISPADKDLAFPMFPGTDGKESVLLKVNKDGKGKPILVPPREVTSDGREVKYVVVKIDRKSLLPEPYQPLFERFDIYGALPEGRAGKVKEGEEKKESPKK